MAQHSNTAVMDEAAFREIRALLLEFKDSLILRLVRGSELTTVEAMKLQGLVDRIRGDDLGGQMDEILSKYMGWSYEEGIASIDDMLKGEQLTTVLNLPKANLDLAAMYFAGKITTITPVLLTEVSDIITLSYTGQKTPGQVASEISKRFDVTMSRAETITRTEFGRLQNLGAESRIQESFDAAEDVGIPMVKVWLHSSGQVTEFAKGKKRAKYKPRPHHKALHGTTVKRGEKFKLVSPKTGITYEIDGPHDEMLPAEEVINCYCKRVMRIDRS